MCFLLLFFLLSHNLLHCYHSLFTVRSLSHVFVRVVASKPEDTHTSLMVKSLDCLSVSSNQLVYCMDVTAVLSHCNHSSLLYQMHMRSCDTWRWIRQIIEPSPTVNKSAYYLDINSFSCTYRCHASCDIYVDTYENPGAYFFSQNSCMYNTK